MAVDEAIMLQAAEDRGGIPTLRIYTWKAACMTIGYFQKYRDFSAMQVPVTRRLTGGLSVRHGADLSYSFTAGKEDWPHIYDQEKTYAVVHAGLKRGLGHLGIPCSFYDATQLSNGGLPGNGICVQTVFPYDLHQNGRKVVGSCQRRRGAVLLQQGSLHLRFEHDMSAVAKALIRGVTDEAGTGFEEGEISSGERGRVRELEQKYASDDWNRKY
jgi:lipoate-protein ligase A